MIEAVMSSIDFWHIHVHQELLFWFPKQDDQVIMDTNAQRANHSIDQGKVKEEITDSVSEQFNQSFMLSNAGKKTNISKITK